MKLLATVLLALVAAVMLGQWLSNDPGVVVLTYGGKVVRTSLSVAIVMAGSAAIAVFILVRTVWRLITWRSRFRRWREQRVRRRRYHNLSAGILALAGGEHQRALRLLTRDTGEDVAAGHWLAAAQAAQAARVLPRRDELLGLARASAITGSLAIDLQHIDMLLADGNLAGASAALAPHLARRPNHQQVLDRQQRLLAAAGRWDEFTELLPRLKRAHVYPSARMIELEAEGAAQLLSKPYGTLVEAQGAWDKLPKATRAVPIAIAAHATVLMRLNETVEAEKVLRKALNSQWDPRLVVLYGELDAPEPTSAVRQAETWLPQHPEDPALLLALGRRCLAAELWGKARSYLEATLARAPSALVYSLLAEASDRMDEPALAAHQRKLGLEFATAAQPLLPPAP